MTRNVTYFFALLFTALALGPSLAHLLELPNKIHLARDDYLTVQQIYRGWAPLGIVLIGALLSNLVLTVLVRSDRHAFTPALIATVCIASMLVVFFAYTYPANQATHNWTTLPEDWSRLRTQREYSHAAGAVLNLIAVVALLVSVLRRER